MFPFLQVVFLSYDICAVASDVRTVDHFYIHQLKMNTLMQDKDVF